MTTHQLADRIAEAAILHGTFTLRSGRTSSYYVDKYLFLAQPDILGQLGKMIADRVSPRTQRLAGAELGGIPLVTAASLATGLPAVYVRNAKKGYGTAKQLEGPLEQGDTVIIVEDIVTSGGQTLEAAEVLRGAGAQIEKIIATVDRQEGARERIEEAGFVFEALFTTDDLGVAK